MSVFLKFFEIILSLISLIIHTCTKNRVQLRNYRVEAHHRHHTVSRCPVYQVLHQVAEDLDTNLKKQDAKGAYTCASSWIKCESF